MPKLVGIRERRWAVYYDTLINAGAGDHANPSVCKQVRLFNGLNLGLMHWTNMCVAASFASDNTFIVLGMSVTINLVANEPTEAKLLYDLLLSHMFVTLSVGDHPQFGAFASDLIVTPETIQTAMKEAVQREPLQKLPRWKEGERHPYRDSAADLVDTKEYRTEYLVSPYAYFEKPIPIPARQHFHAIVDITGPHQDDVLNGLNKA